MQFCGSGLSTVISDYKISVLQVLARIAKFIYC